MHVKTDSDGNIDPRAAHEGRPVAGGEGGAHRDVAKVFVVTRGFTDPLVSFCRRTPTPLLGGKRLLEVRGEW